MVIVIAAIIIALLVIGVVSLMFSIKDNQNWLSRRFTGHAPAKVDEEELEQLEHDRLGDT